MTRRIPTAQQIEASRKCHFFRDDDDNQVIVITQQLPNGAWCAWFDEVPDCPQGAGDTRLEAIANLRDSAVELL